MFNDSKWRTSSKSLTTISAITLFVLFTTGCAQKKELQPEAASPDAKQSVAELPVRVKKVQSEGCRTCHSSALDESAEVFSSIFDTPKLHHPVGVRYPDTTVVPNFAKPSGEQDGVVFFDRNENRMPDNDEIMLFGTTGDATVECASCHVEHEGPSATSKDPAKLYLRFENTGSAMCTTCHQY